MNACALSFVFEASLYLYSKVVVFKAELFHLSSFPPMLYSSFVPVIIVNGSSRRQCCVLYSGSGGRCCGGLGNSEDVGSNRRVRGEWRSHHFMD